MEPARQESVSRQSSILKAPKQRQPLQIVATNPSSSESSPTIKLKRRVSFAKNKRIREFCNEVEPKEGLDDSYEEHDLSSTKSSSGNSMDQPLVISVACEDKENFPIQLFIPTDQFECKEIPPAPSCVEEDNLSQWEMEMDNSINMPQLAEMQNKETTLSNATIYFNDGMDITVSIQPQIISAHVGEASCYNDMVPVSQTCIEDMPMEMTENLQSILSKKLVPAQNTNHSVNFENNTLNFTEPVSTILGIGNVRKLFGSQDLNKLAENCESETECFTNAPLEFTSLIPSSTWIRLHNQSQDNDETERFNCKTMEFTEVAQIHNIMCKDQTKETLTTSDEVMRALLDQKDSKIPDAHLKQPQYNEICQEKNEIPSNNSIVKTETTSNQNIINQTSNVIHSLSEIMQEKINIFPNASMDITEAVPVHNGIETLPLSESRIQERIPEEETKLHIDASMEMTEIIANPNQTAQHTGCKNKVLSIDPSKTKIFFNTSMEITEAVPHYKKINQPNKIVSKTHPRNMQDKTKLFNDNSMEITEAVGFNHYKHQLIGSKSEITRKTQPGNTSNKTKIFNDNSMEMTEALSFNHYKNQLMASENEIAQRTQPESMTNKTKVFHNNSMEITEALGFNHQKNQLMTPENENTNIPDKIKVVHDNSMKMKKALDFNGIQKPNFSDNQLMASVKESTQLSEIAEKTQPRSIPDKTKVFHDNSMEMTETLGLKEIQKTTYCKSLVIPPENEETQVYVNASMELTEAVLINNKNNKSVVTTNKTHYEVTQDKTKIFNDKSMEVTEAVIHHNKNSSLSKFDNNQTSDPRQEKTKLFFNTSMEMTECTPRLLSNSNQPVVIVQKTDNDVSLQKTELFCNKSMEITEAVPVYNRIHHCITNNEENQQEDRTKMIQNKSMVVTQTVLNYNKSDLLCSHKNQLAELGGEQTKFFCNASMEITEAVPIISKAHELGFEFKNKFCRYFPGQTEIFQNRSMGMTEAVNNSCGKKYNFEKSMEKSEGNGKMQEKTRALPNMSMTEPIPVNKEIWKCNVENSTETVRQPNNLNENLGIEVINSGNKTINILRDDKTKYFNNKSMDFTKILPVLSHQSVPSYVQNNVPDLMTDKTKHFFNNSMDVTEAVMKNQTSISANPSILCNSLKDSERLHQYDTTMPNEINILNLNHTNNKKDEGCNISSYRDKSFHRMTTDELHTLCASMNLPTQNYTTERTATLPNDYISICNDVNVLRDSLQKNSIFQQNFTIGTGISIAMDNNIQISTNVTENLNKQDDVLCNTNSDSVERGVTTGEDNLRILKTKSMELDIKYLQDQDAFSISNKSHKNTTSDDNTKCSESYILNDKQKSNIYSLDKSETLQMHNVLAFSTERKSSTKRKSAEMDEHFEIAENNLKRLPSDNTEFLIATMGIRSELSHPLIINDRTTIKVSCAPLENNAHTLSFCSNETIRPEGNVSRGGEHEKFPKTITTSMIEDVFHEKCSSLNKENEISKNKKSSGEIESFSENSMNQLDEIQPPSFLCSDSFQTDSLNGIEMINNASDAVSNEIIQEPVNETSEKQYYTENSDSCNSKNSSTRETRQSLQNDFSPSISIHSVDSAKILCENVLVNKLSFFNNSKNFNESEISLINEENINTDPFAPFTALTKSIEICEKRDNCIWTIRKIDQKMIAADFISQSFVTIIRLNEIEKACIKDIEDIQFISRLHSGSKNILLKIVHCLLLSKLKPDKLLSQYKMYEDVLPLLEFVSNEVIVAINFMFDLERLSSLNVLNVESERVWFMVSSKKANIILKISLMIKVFNEIGPDDITVTRVLGDVRINDIKQLIVNIRKDSSFLSRYINDVKDYIMLMEESHVQR